jgi:hypothetical protein
MCQGAEAIRCSALLARVRAEFHEMPGLRLSHAQFCRLLGVDAPAADVLIATLVDEGFLEPSKFGGYLKTEPR